MRWAFVLLVACAACVGDGGDARELEVANVIAKADESLIRVRPVLVAGKYALMSTGAFPFSRGALALYRHDMRESTTDDAVSRYSLDVLVPSLGDAHPENFGTLRASDGTYSLEPNDFDAAEREPYLWDVRRLACTMAIAASVSNADDPAAQARTAAQRRAISRKVAEGYAAGPAGRITGGDDPILADVFSRSVRDAATRRELGELTTLVNGTRTLLRGGIDPADPESQLIDLPAFARTSLDATVARYRTTLLSPPDAAYFQILDAARELGTGVSSWPRIRLLLLVRGPSDDPSDDVILEMKELADSGIAGLHPPGVDANDVPSRVLAASRAAWSRPDAEPLWGVSDWLGFPIQIRAETEAHKSVRVERMVGDRGTPEALSSLAFTLGTLIARIHASTDIQVFVAQDRAGFADEQADFGDRCAARSLEDHRRFVDSLARLGPRLGVPFDPSDRPSPDLAALFAIP